MGMRRSLSHVSLSFVSANTWRSGIANFPSVVTYSVAIVAVRITVARDNLQIRVRTVLRRQSSHEEGTNPSFIRLVALIQRNGHKRPVPPVLYSSDGNQFIIGEE